MYFGDKSAILSLITQISLLIHQFAVSTGQLHSRPVCWTLSFKWVPHQEHNTWGSFRRPVLPTSWMTWSSMEATSVSRFAINNLQSATLHSITWPLQSVNFGVGAGCIKVSRSTIAREASTFQQVAGPTRRSTSLLSLIARSQILQLVSSPLRFSLITKCCRKSHPWERRSQWCSNSCAASWRWTLLAGKAGSTTITGLGGGNQYVPNEPKRFQGAYAPPTQPALCITPGPNRSTATFQLLHFKVFEPLALSEMARLMILIISSMPLITPLQQEIVVYFDSGRYKITYTLFIPAGTRLVGEAYPIIMSSGNFFNDKNNTKLVVQVGNAGQSGQVEWPDMIVSTQGAQVGVISIEWNLAASGTPSGMWDVHVRIGGFAVSNLQVPQCPKIPGNPTVNGACIAAYMLMHVTSSASNFYMENVWL